MIRVTVDLVPFGDESLKKKIGSLVLANMGRIDLAEYQYMAVYEDDMSGEHLAHVTHVRSEGVWELLRKLLTEHEVVDADHEIFDQLKEKLNEH